MVNVSGKVDGNAICQQLTDMMTKSLSCLIRKYFLKEVTCILSSWHAYTYLNLTAGPYVTFCYRVQATL